MFNQIPIAGAAVTRALLHSAYQTSVSQSSHTFSGVPFGTAHPDRRILIVQAANGEKTTCTVAGNPTALLVTGSGALPVNHFMLHLPTGTSGSVVVSGSNSINCAIHVYSLIPASDTPVDTLDTIGGSLNTHGCVIGGCCSGENLPGTASVVWDNLTEDAVLAWTSTFASWRFSVASRGDAPSSLSLTPTGAGTVNMAAASFKPF